MNSNPFVSVIIPMYNAEQYIQETISSVLSQSYENFEVIVVDNFSSDNSKEIIKSLNDARIELVELDYNSGGPSRPRNIGAKNANGELICFLDADDIWLPNKLESQINFFIEHEINFSSTDCTLINESSVDIPISFKNRIFNKFISKKTITDVIKNNFILTSSVIIRKDLLLSFNENDTYISVEDYDMWLNILLNKECKYLYQNKKLIKYRIVENSASERSSVLKQELKANVVLSNFVLKNPKYLGAYFHRMFFHLLRKKIKSNSIK